MNYPSQRKFLIYIKLRPEQVTIQKNIRLGAKKQSSPIKSVEIQPHILNLDLLQVCYILLIFKSPIFISGRD